jgi:hypothetical protein
MRDERKPPVKEMLDWPTGAYEDSGEGGMFAWMVIQEEYRTPVPADSPYAEASDNCHVDVAAYLSRSRLMLDRPDVCVSPERTQLWEPFDYRNSWFEKSGEIRKRLKLNLDNEKDRNLSGGLMRTLGQDDISMPLLAAVFLGSTGASMWDPAKHEYFTAQYGHLTQNGKTLYDGLRLAYGVEPTLLTFLDT